MKNLCLLILVISFINVSAQNEYEYLDANNINAAVNSNGTLFMTNRVDTVVVNGVIRTYSPSFNVPKLSTRNAIFAGNLWIAGIDEGGILHTAANTYGQSGTDFWAGPITSNYNETYDSTYNKVWVLTKTEIEYHKNNFNLTGYSMPWSIANWPANGNFLNNMALKLAPFNDLNNNSRYEPELGEYPIILGDQATYFIFNDDRGLHGQTNGNKLGIEIHAMAYSFESTDSDLDNTIFINYKIYNRSENNYSNLKLGLWTDFRLGCPFNDMIGCDTLLNTYFCYNGAPVDACGINGYGNFPPAQGVTFLNAKMSSFNDAAFNIIVANNADRYYQLLSGNKSDGSSYLRPTDNECTIDLQSIPTKFLYFDDPNDTSPSAYSEINCSPLQGNKKALGAIDILSLPAKSNVCIDVAFPFAQDSNGTNLTSVALLKQRVVAIQDFYNNNPNIAGCSALFLATSITENSPEKSFLKVFPNPAKNELFVFLEGMYLKEKMEITIYDVTGKIIFSEQVLANNLKIDIETLQSGMYFINASAKGFFQSNRFIKY